MNLSANKICVTLGGKEILRGVSCDFASGKRTAIIGPNGAGKSTLLKVLCLLNEKFSGRVTLDGQDLRRAQVFFRRLRLMNLSAEKICVTLGGKEILRGVSCDFPSGKRTAIIGPNGAGKSTLLKVLCLLNEKFSGRVTLDGQDLRRAQVFFGG